MRSRTATPNDAAAIAAIYNQGIAERIATFETRPRSANDVRAWFDGAHPIVVVEDGGQVIAFASTSTYRPRECYAGIAEFSVYVARDARKRGAGHPMEPEQASDMAARAHLVITGGVNVYPAEVEAALIGHPAVGDVGVIGVPDDDWGEIVVAVVEPQPGVEPSRGLVPGGASVGRAAGALPVTPGSSAPPV